jgi:magnesium-transporting ATPase (P-type)
LSLLLAFATAAPEIIVVIAVFLITFFLSFFRAYYPKKWGGPMVFAEVIMIVELLVGFREYEMLNLVTRQYVYCVLVSCAMFTLGIIIVFPTTASGVLEVTLVIKEMLNIAE